MTRYRYNQPAPFVYISLQTAEGDAADRTVVPLGLAEELGLVALDSIPVLGFGGILMEVPTFLVSLTLRGESPMTLKVLASTDEPYILLGRDILNHYRARTPKMMSKGKNCT